MELTVRIQEQLPLQEREYYNNRTGSNEKFASMGFLLSHGTDTFYAEMIQEQARAAAQYAKNCYYVAHINFASRPWTDQQGVERFENRLTLTSLAVL